MNSVIVTGRLTHAPELKFTPGKGTAVTTFTIACGRQFKKEGQDDTDFFNIIVWGKLAEVCSNYLIKGQYANVRGRLQNRKYTNKAGIDVHITEIIADTVDFLEKPKGSAEVSKESNFQKSSNDNFNSYQDSGVTPLDDGETPF
jgi:single-strand DNA-binding protein